MCSKGKLMVPSNPIMSLLVPPTLMIQYSHPMGHHRQGPSHSRRYGLFSPNSNPPIGFYYFLAFFGHKWLSMMAHGVTILGHEGRGYHGWHHRIEQDQSGPSMTTLREDMPQNVEPFHLDCCWKKNPTPPPEIWLPILGALSQTKIDTIFGISTKN